MLRDFDVIKVAWDKLVTANASAAKFSVKKGPEAYIADLDTVTAENNGAFSKKDNRIKDSLKGTTALLEEYGAIEPGEKPVRDVQVPRKTEKQFVFISK